jgi:hypothetical protein
MSMKLFRYTMGHTDIFAAALDAQDAYDRREQIDVTFGWTPVVIEEVTLEGFQIVLFSDEELRDIEYAEEEASRREATPEPEPVAPKTTKRK